MRRWKRRSDVAQAHRPMDSRGEVLVEYLIVLGAVTLVALQAFSAIGPRIVATYLQSRAILLSIDP